MSRSENPGYLYINGLGDGQTKLHEQLAIEWWQLGGLELFHAHIDWFDGEPLDKKVFSVKGQTRELLGDFGGIALVGSSAGGSLALNSFFEMRDEKVSAVIAHGRLRKGNYPTSHRNSLFRRAHLNTPRPSLSFYDSVVRSEEKTIPSLSSDDKKRILVLTQLADLVVPSQCMGIEGSTTHQSKTIGHSGGFLAHMFADRDLIDGFARQSLEL